jgi:hypothetical protein
MIEKSFSKSSQASEVEFRFLLTVSMATIVGSLTIAATPSPATALVVAPTTPSPAAALAAPSPETSPSVAASAISSIYTRAKQLFCIYFEVTLVICTQARHTVVIVME